MPTITTNDGVDIFFKDWGSGQPIVFSHGWPLSADDWDTQMLFFLQHGYRVVAHDRRGHGRSAQVADGHDMDHYADDLAAVVEHLDLHDAIHVGHSTGGGEVAHYLARHGENRAVKAALISAVPPLMVKTDANPDGLLKDVFDDLQAQLAANRSEFYRALPSGFLLRVQPARGGFVGGDHRELVASGDDGRREGTLRRHRGVLADRLHRGPKEDHDPRAGHAQRGRPDRALRRRGSAVGRVLSNGTLKTYQGFPHGMPTTQADVINADLLDFFRS
jgi:non-heme chloroperoxidase